MAVLSPDRRNLPWLAARVPLGIALPLWLRYRARGMEHLAAGGGLLLANHQSFLDPPLIGFPLSRPVSFLARDNLFRVPLVGAFMRGIHVMPINRESVGPGSIKEAIRRMRDGHLVCLFPEGTRTFDGQVGELKPGFLALARLARVPVYPIGIAGAFEAFPRGATFIRPRTVRVVFGAALPADAVQGDQNEVLLRVHTALVALHAEATAWRHGVPSAN